jgi:transcriptional regulator with XRE-family HTH domain
MLSDRLKKVIGEHFSSMKAASENMDIPYRTLQNYVSGKQMPGSEALIKLHDKINVDLNWLLTGTSSDNSRDTANKISRREEWADIELMASIISSLGKETKIYDHYLHENNVIPLLTLMYSVKRKIRGGVFDLENTTHNDILDEALEDYVRSNHGRAVFDSVEVTNFAQTTAKEPSKVNQDISGTSHTIAGNDITITSR